MLDEGTYITTLQNIHKLGLKAQCFKSADFSMLGRGRGVSQYPQFYDTIKKINRLEVLFLPTKLVHIIYCCYVCSLIKHSFQISTKLRYIRIKESVHSISYRFLKLKEPSTFSLSVHVIDFFLHLILVVISLAVSSMYAPLTYCFVGTKTLLWVN